MKQWCWAIMATIAAICTIGGAQAAEMPAQKPVASMVTGSSGSTLAGLLETTPRAERIIVAQRRGRRGRRGRRIGTGLAIGAVILGAAIIASESARADSRHARRCRQWQRQCNRGNDRSCWRVDNRC